MKRKIPRDITVMRIVLIKYSQNKHKQIHNESLIDESINQSINATMPKIYMIPN